MLFSSPISNIPVQRFHVYADCPLSFCSLYPESSGTEACFLFKLLLTRKLEWRLKIFYTKKKFEMVFDTGRYRCIRYLIALNIRSVSLFTSMVSLPVFSFVVRLIMKSNRKPWLSCRTIMSPTSIFINWNSLEMFGDDGLGIQV